MAILGPTVPISQRQQRITFQNPGPAVPDGDGGFTQVYAPLSPADLFAAIAAPTARDLERLAAGTVISTAMRMITFPFHPDVNTETRITWTDVAGRPHAASVIGVDNPGERCIETVVLAVEIVT